MSEYIISDEQIVSERRQAYEAGKRNREVWTAREYHGEEIVRCRDCKFYGYGKYATHCYRFVHKVEPDGFCKWGVNE